MSGFVAAAPAPVPVPIADAIPGDDWQPALSIAAFRDAMRLPAAVTDGRCRAALVGAALSVAVALSSWRAAQIFCGVVSLETASLPPGLPSTIGGEATAVALWRRAAFHFAAADLVDTHHEITATDAGRGERDARAASVDQLRRAATVAIRDLTGRGRSKVALV